MKFVTRKIYCYIDETGQDTKGDIFIVTVVIPEKREELREYLDKIEVETGKEKFKWGKADPIKRYKYLETVFSQKKHLFKIYFSYYKNTKEYKALTILSIFKAIKSTKNFMQHKFIFIIDALGEKDRKYYGSELHKLGVPSKEVKGIKREQSNALIRLADSTCGFIRDVIENESKNEHLRLLYEQALKQKLLVEV